MAVPPGSVRIPRQTALTPSVTSVTSLANKGDNEMIPEAVDRSPGICLTAEENPGKPQLGDRLLKGLCDQSLPQMGPFPPNEVGRIAQHIRDGDRRKKGKGGKRDCISRTDQSQNLKV